MRIVVIVLFVVLLLVGIGQGVEETKAASLSATELAGIWKLCYEPGLPGVSEVSGAYLVLMPDLRYYEVRDDCCRDMDDPPSNPGITGSYSIEGQVVVQHCINIFGKPYDRRLRFVPNAKVVTFDAREGPVIQGPVLQIGDNLNYGYVKVFWHENWLTR